MGSKRTTAISPMTGFLGCLISALLQIFLALAPIEALADEAGPDTAVTASHSSLGSAGGFVLGGDDPVSDTLERAFEPGEVLAALRQEAGPPPRQSILVLDSAPDAAGTVAFPYHTRAPPLASLT